VRRGGIRSAALTGCVGSCSGQRPRRWAIVSKAQLRSAGFLPWQEVSRDRDQPVAGHVYLNPSFALPELGDARRVWLGLPDRVFRSDAPVPLLIMLDGRNAFWVERFPYSDWRADEAIVQLEAEDLPVGIVAVDHGVSRSREYSPFSEHSVADQHVRALVDHVKPEIERLLGVDPGTSPWGILGSSLGGLHALYAFFTRPDVFSFAGAMSPALVRNPAAWRWLEQQRFVPGKLYLDHGGYTGADGADWRYDSWPIYQLLVGKGYRPGVDILQVFESEGRHQEWFWARRLPGALRFLLQQ
jgi:predicted alpha/beta superfamily hydrolase